MAPEVGSGSRVGVAAFGWNLALFAVRILTHLIYFTKRFINVVLLMGLGETIPQ